jgi:hypothetical protein
MILVLCTLAVIGAAFICYRHIRGHLGTARQRTDPANAGEEEQPAPATGEPDDTRNTLSEP